MKKISLLTYLVSLLNPFVVPLLRSPFPLLTDSLSLFVQMPGLSIDPLLCHVPSLYHASPSFLQDTSAPIGALGLYIKATILLGRVVNYTQRFPRYLVIPLGESCSSMKRDIKAG